MTKENTVSAIYKKHRPLHKGQPTYFIKAIFSNYFA